MKRIELNKKFFSIVYFLIINFLIVYFILFSFSEFSTAQGPPSTINVNGFVFNSDLSGAPNGVVVRVWNVDLDQFFFTQVFAPPIPQLMGAYSLSVNGSVGDLLVVNAYNSSHYGEKSKQIVSSNEKINVTLNLSRNGEINVTIISPAENSLFDAGEYFNLSVNVSVIINDVTGCFLIPIISNLSVINSSSGDLFIGDLSLGSSNLYQLEFFGVNKGFSRIDVYANCSSDVVLFEGLNYDYIFNVSIQDSNAPIVNLILPLNNSIIKSDNDVLFSFNASDNSLIDSCIFFLNGTINETFNDVISEVPYNFSLYLPNGDYNWYVSCNDSSGFNGESLLFIFNLSVYAPEIYSVHLNPSIILSAGGKKTVYCNFSVTDLNGISDIFLLNTTLIREGYSLGVPDNTSFYFNDSCQELSSTNVDANYSCVFDLLYYARNGTWFCNVSTQDFQGLQGNELNSTHVEPLYALNVSSSVIDYGDVSAGFLSSENLISVYNLGNQPVSLMLRGYGGFIPELGENYSFFCGSSNISINNHRFSLGSSLFESKNNLSSSFISSGLIIQPQNSNILSYNETYWQVYVPPMDLAECVGTVVFLAQE